MRRAPRRARARGFFIAAVETGLTRARTRARAQGPDEPARGGQARGRVDQGDPPAPGVGPTTTSAIASNAWRSDAALVTPGMMKAPDLRARTPAQPSAARGN